MQEIIIPNDGLIYKTIDNRPVMQISLVNEATLFKLFSKNEYSSLLLLCHDTESGIFIGNGQKSIKLVVNEEKTEIRFTNENGKVTHFFHTTEDGGQIDLCSDEGEPLISMGVNPGDISSFHLRSKNGRGIVTIMNDKDNGRIVLLDNNGNIIWSSPNE